MKYLIFDSGPLINFAMNGLLNTLVRLKKHFNGEFLITEEIKNEIIDVPSTIKKYELEALQIKKLFDEKIITYPNISEKQFQEFRNLKEEIMNKANTTFYNNNKNIHLIDKGESSVLALYLILKNSSVIVIDERTTRVLCENPKNLKKILEKKLNIEISVREKNLEYFKKFKIIRSSELAYIAYKKGLIDLESEKLLEALLYGLKYRGCSISEEEIEEIKKSS